jgi:hypothetical protein
VGTVDSGTSASIDSVSAGVGTSFSLAATDGTSASVWGFAAVSMTSRH